MGGVDRDILVALEIHENHVLPRDARRNVRSEKKRLHPPSPGTSQRAE